MTCVLLKVLFGHLKKLCELLIKLFGTIIKITFCLLSISIIAVLKKIFNGQFKFYEGLEEL